MDAITAFGLTKQYAGLTVLQGLNLQVQQGSAMACAGWENSGKTTLIRLLSGLCRPTAGECAVLGMSPAFETAKLHARLGVVLDKAPLYSGMTLGENLRFFAGIHNMDGNDSLERSSFLLHRLGIWEYRDEKAGTLPTGVARRASLARALMHSPQVLLMDEATSGLDQSYVPRLLDWLERFLTGGGRLVWCSHHQPELDRLCGAVLRLEEGRLTGGTEE